ncbi:MAG: alpha/beta hydrolase [Woeseiaceae bacterium]|nr:alpha/beta hydrolase [Woeseiaceae bacterium]
MFPKPQFISSNGIRMAVYEEGAGPAVVMVHGFPELAYSWRHQIPALANAGFRAIAPDMRGYGRSDAPTGVDQYCVTNLIGDLLGMLDALGIERATFVGHDWGALVLWQMAMLAPDRIDKLIALNVPHYPRSPIDPIQLFRERLGNDFYIVNFQDSDAADTAFAADPTHFFNMMMRRNQISRREFDQLPPQMKVLSLLKGMQRRQFNGEPLLNDEERAYYINAFSISGFTNPINWYRNWTRNWRVLEGVDPIITIPTLFIGAVDDVIIAPEHVEAMKPLVTDLTIEMLEPCGHWTQQERPDDVNRLIIRWLAGPG